MKNESYEKLWKELKKAEKILLIGHRGPDGDALGSMCSMKIWLDGEGKDVDLGCVDKPTQKYSFLPFMRDVKNKIVPSEYDLIMILDCGAHYMTNFHEDHPEILATNPENQGAPFIVNIDHHSSNDRFGHINIVDSDSASATMILYDIFTYLGVSITPDMATCLITGIYNDTGSFMHSNSSQKVFEVASDLTARGAKVSPLIKSLFKTSTVDTLKAWGKAFSNARVTNDNCLFSVVKNDGTKKGEETDQLSGAIDYLNMVPGVEYTLLLQEDKKLIKGSLRTRREDVDLSKIAEGYGGGGHQKAAGFCIRKKM
jgi:bifunctional oligoribonuclease and PAP phosphatase NrnA